MPKKFKFAAMKLTGQASQYWTNLEIMCAAFDQETINTWHRIKNDLREKYVPSSFSACLMDECHQYNQGYKSVKEYMAKFDEFLIRWNTLNT